VAVAPEVSLSGVPVGRYAPSPTGALHLGNLRTALAAWAWARSRGGKFLLRIEDLDGPRVKPHAEERQRGDLQRLGIEWDKEQSRQSSRTDAYTLALGRLGAMGYAYPCFCSRKDIEAAASAPHGEEGSVRYPGMCANLDEKAAEARVRAGRQHAFRVRVERAPKEWHDEFCGDFAADLENLGGDFVVRRADGLFAYQLACALDDACDGINEVLRGADLLESAPRQAWLLKLLDCRVPSYAHIPLLLGENGVRLSKRDGADDLGAFLSAGYDATAIRSYLAHTLGQCEAGERVSAAELARRFDLSKVPRNQVQVSRATMSLFRP